MNNGGELYLTDQIQLRSYALAIFRNFEANFDEMQAGNLNEAEQTKALQSIVRNEGQAAPLPWYDYWQIYRARANPEFLQWMEEVVFNGGECPLLADSRRTLTVNVQPYAWYANGCFWPLADIRTESKSVILNGSF